ncbi:roadblock/LC7 domain-containing protein [Trichloromonas sp.]|uniref:roadblock/LC7 domain-containing protein n=1 Tax=Trichloromonas sp. TaxID=3069249 RepID=UPI002A4884AA|nr:roadblock/LC7 domain-containing protein [Trichloromonas sp.]
MAFKVILGDLVAAVPDAGGAILADWEGEAVDQVACMDDYELKVIGAHKGVILNQLRDLVRRLEGADPREIIITTDRMEILILPVTSDYFLVLTLARGQALGRALFEARRCVARLIREIG